MSRSKNIVTQSDHEELKKAYKFVLPDDSEHAIDDSAGASESARSNSNSTSSRWQDRMVERYHEHLYKTHVIADLTQISSVGCSAIGGGISSSSSSNSRSSSLRRAEQKAATRIGLRWRTKKEVVSGKGVDTCGNKHCPCYYDYNRDAVNQETKRTVEEVRQWKSNPENSLLLDEYYKYVYLYVRSSKTHKQEEWEEEKQECDALRSVPHGLGLHNYEVHFSYVEHGEKKEELVQLKLCLRCAPKLFHDKGGVIGARLAREHMNNKECVKHINDDDRTYGMIGGCNKDEHGEQQESTSERNLTSAQSSSGTQQDKRKDDSRSRYDYKMKRKKKRDPISSSYKKQRSKH